MATTDSEHVSKRSNPRRSPGSKAEPLLISSTAIFTASAHSRPGAENLGPHGAAGSRCLIPARGPPAQPPPTSVPGALRGVGLRPAAEICVLCSAQREEPTQHVVPMHPELPGQTQGSPHRAAQESREAQESQA